MELAKELDKEMAKSIGIKLMLARDNAEFLYGFFLPNGRVGDRNLNFSTKR